MRKTPLLAAVSLALSHSAWACTACAPLVQARIHDADFWLNLVLVMSPAAVIGLLAWMLHGGEGEPSR
jgi:hypothetical protein